MKVEKLEFREIEALNSLIEKRKKKFIVITSIIFFIGIVVSLIPVSFLPKSGRLSEDVDKSLNAIQSLGFEIWSVFFIISVGGFILAAYADSQLFYLKKDKRDQEKVFCKVRVSKIFNWDKENIYQVILKAEGIKKIVLNLDRNTIKNYQKGQEIDVVVLKNARIQISDFVN